MSDVIPFRKYRGQEVAQVMQRDPACVQWLMQQAWFPEKFAPIYQLVVNNFAAPSEETPAHNALQVQFLELDFRAAFWRAGLDKEADWAGVTESHRKARRVYFRVPCLSAYHRRHDDSERHRQHHRKEVIERWANWRFRHDPAVQQLLLTGPVFEEDADVEFTAIIVAGFPGLSDLDAKRKYRLFIEIKPSMGDDYPAVLRQIKRQRRGVEV
jgi:hypothetical protein